MWKKRFCVLCLMLFKKITRLKKRTKKRKKEKPSFTTLTAIALVTTDFGETSSTNICTLWETAKNKPKMSVYRIFTVTYKSRYWTSDSNEELNFSQKFHEESIHFNSTNVKCIRNLGYLKIFIASVSFCYKAIFSNKLTE